MNKKYKVLIADDDKEFVKALREQLESAGYDVICAYEAVRAVELAHREHPDIITLDWKMPTGRGGAVLASLTEKNDTRKIPVIVITATEEPSIAEKSRLFRVKEVIYKPCDLKLVLQKIRETLEWKQFEESLV